MFLESGGVLFQFGVLVVDVDHLPVHSYHTRSPRKLRIVSLGEPQHGLLYEIDSFGVERLFGRRFVPGVVAPVHITADDLLLVEQTGQQFNAKVLIRV